MKKFLRKIEPQSKILNSIYKEENGKIFSDNSESNLGNRYWISPIIGLSNDSLRLSLDSKYWDITYLGCFIDKLPIPIRFYNRSVNDSPINNIQASFLKIYFHSDAIFRQPFEILNITSSYENPSYPLNNLDNTQPSTYYLNDSGAAQTITFETMNPDALQYLSLYFEYDNNATFVDVSKIEVSSDGTNWTDLTFDSVFDYSFTGETITKRIKVYGNFDSYPTDTKFVRITLPNNCRINQFCLHRKNNDYLINDKFYIRTLNSEADMFIATSTSYLDRPTIYPRPVPKNKSYTPGTVIDYEETFNISNLPNDTIFKIPQLRIKARKKPIFFDINRLGVEKQGLNATRNGIFYPAKRIDNPSMEHNCIFDYKEIIIPNQGRIKTDHYDAGFVLLTGQVNTDLINGWKDGLLGSSRYANGHIEESNSLQFLNGTHTGNYARIDNQGIIVDVNRNPISKTFRSQCSINGEIFYPGDTATIYPGEYVDYNNIERFYVISINYWASNPKYLGTRVSSIQFKELQSVSRQFVDSEFVSIETDEIPYRLEIEYPEPSLRIMVSLDGTNWYGIDRTNNNFQKYTDISESVLTANGLTLDELNELLPGLVLDTNYNHQMKFVFYLPYSEAKYKTMTIWLNLFKGQYIKQIYSFDNGNTWNRYNPLTRSFEQIIFTNNNDAFDQATFVYNLPIDKIPSGTTDVKIKYLFSSNYDFDVPEILTPTRYETSQPKTITRKIMEGNEIHPISEIVKVIDYKYAGGNYLYKDNVFLSSKDEYSKKKNHYKLYIFRGGIFQSTRLENILGKDLGIDDNQTIEAYFYLNARGDAKPQKITLAGIDILESGVIQGGNIAPFSATKDLRALKKIKMTRNGQIVDLIFTWTNNTTDNLQLQNYQQGLNDVKVNFYANNNNRIFEILTRNLVFESNYDIVNEYPFDITLLSHIDGIRYFIEPLWVPDVFKPTKFIISVDGTNWYGLIDNTPVLINNPNDITEIQQNGMTDIEYYHYGIDNWLSFFNITANNQIVKIRNDRKPISFVPFKEFDNSLNEYNAISVYSHAVITKDKFVI